MESASRKIRIVYCMAPRIMGIRKDNDGMCWVHFEGSRESIAIGDNLDWKVGDRVKITFDNLTEKERDAQPSQPPI